MSRRRKRNGSRIPVVILTLFGVIITGAAGVYTAGRLFSSGLEWNTEEGLHVKPVGDLELQPYTGNNSDSEDSTASAAEESAAVAEEETNSAAETEAVVSDTTYTTARVNLRTGPSTDYEAAGQLDPGTEVNVTAAEGDWTTVDRDGQTFYIASQYLYTPPQELPAMAAAPELPTEPGWIFNTQKNENGEYEGGEEGDQTGEEARIEAYPSYYSDSEYPWQAVFRCKDTQLAAEAVRLACAAAANDALGYDSGDLRLTLAAEAEKAGWDTSAIGTPCSANCVTSVLIFYKCAGQRLGIESVADLNADGHTSTMEEILLGTGFFEKVADANPRSPDGNRAGDIYVAESHAILQLTNGASSGR